MIDHLSPIARLMAQSSLMRKAIATTHQKSLESIPSRQDKLIADIKTLRQQIKDAGVGQRSDLELLYLSKLTALRALSQSAAMGEHGKDVDPALQKAIDYGQLLLDVYGDRALIKGAVGDLEAHGQRLIEMDNVDARAIGWRLLEVVS